MTKITLLHDINFSDAVNQDLQILENEESSYVQIGDFIPQIINFCISYFDCAIDITKALDLGNGLKLIKKKAFFRMIFETFQLFLNTHDIGQDLMLGINSLKNSITIDLSVSTNSSHKLQKDFINNIQRYAELNYYSCKLKQDNMRVHITLFSQY